MPKAYSGEIRERVITEVESGAATPLGTTAICAIRPFMEPVSKGSNGRRPRVEARPAYLTTSAVRGRNAQQPLNVETAQADWVLAGRWLAVSSSLFTVSTSRGRSTA